MINMDLLKRFKRDDFDENLYSLFLGFDNSKRDKYYSQKYFDIENIIPDKILNAKKLSNVIESKIGKKFVSRLENTKFAWNPQFIKSTVDLNNIEKYLSQCATLQKKKSEYFGEIEINDIYTFLSVFMDYPQKFNYQDIEIYSLTSNFAINISNHGTVWILGIDCVIMNEIFSSLNDENLIIIKGNKRI